MLFVILFCLTRAATSFVELNVALRKSGTVCSGEEISGLFDGNRDIDVVIPMICSLIPYIEVYLGSMYYIHYTVLYRSGKKSDSFTTFRILLKVKDTPISQYCGDYTTFTESTNSLVSNCPMSQQQYSEVSIMASTNSANVWLTELEVYSLTSETHSGVTVVHRGCFTEFLSYIQKRHDNESDCFRYCSEEEYSVAALTMEVPNSSLCHCSKGFNKSAEVPMRECKRRCGSWDDVCGYVSRYSVYIVMIQLPYYIGCMNYKTLPNDTINTTSKEMTITKCLQFCDCSRFAFLKNGDQCICSNFTLVGESCKCKTTCSGSGLQICGDLNCASIYGTCLREEVFTLSCSYLFNCKRDHDGDGLCNGDCKPGFGGKHCIERNGTADECHISDPCRENAICKVVDDGVTHCSCEEGYYENPITGECIYADESSAFFIVFVVLIIAVLFVIYWTFSSKRKTLSIRESVMTATSIQIGASRRPSQYKYKIFPGFWKNKTLQPSTISSGTTDINAQPFQIPIHF